MENKREFINVMNQAALIFDKDLVHSVIEAYWLLLKEYDFDEFKEAMNQVCRSIKFWPRPSEIIMAVEKNRENMPAIEIRAEIQWRIVIDAVRKNGLNKPVNFDDPITQHIVSRGFSWQYLCDINIKNENWEQKRFCRSYELASKAWETNPQIEQMPDRVKKLVRGIG